MMIKFNPQKAEKQTTASINGDILTYNGEKIDLSKIPAGATAKAEFLTIEKDDENHATITMLWQYTEPTLVNSFPADLIVESGKITPKESTK